MSGDCMCAFASEVRLTLIPPTLSFFTHAVPMQPIACIFFYVCVMQSVACTSFFKVQAEEDSSSTSAEVTKRGKHEATQKPSGQRHVAALTVPGIEAIRHRRDRGAGTRQSGMGGPRGGNLGSDGYSS
jgi:hypothetical protein